MLKFSDMKSWFSGHFSTSITKLQVQGSGMAVVLILLIIGLATKEDIYYKISIGTLVMNMIFPMFFYPFAVFWYGLGNVLGSVVSRVLLLIIYLVILLPVALFRQLIGKDPLLLKKFKKDTGTVMKSRNHTYEAGDLEKPF
jgi:hypothetical protein